MMLKIYNLDDTDEVDSVCTLGEGEHLIGRGDILNCNDERVSRKHAVINVGKDVVTIKSVHINPCFFKAASGNNIAILSKDTSVVLNDGDQFALLADTFWFRVRINLKNDTISSTERNGLEKRETELEHNKTVSAGNGDSPNKFKSEDFCNNNHPSTSKRCSDEESKVSTKRTKMSDENKSESNMLDKNTLDKNVLPIEDNSSRPSVLPDIELLQTTLRTSQNSSLTDENLGADIDSSKLIDNLKNILEEDYGSKKTENLVDKDEKVVNKRGDSKDEVGLTTASTSNNVEVKQEMPDQNINIKKETYNSDKENDEQNKRHNTGDINMIKGNNVKTEKVEEATAQPDKNDGSAQNNQNDPSCSTGSDNKIKTRRERCFYGPNCYRKNPIHRQDFSHPGDNDYDSDPDDDRPNCPFGGACYRKNLEHRRQFKHSNPPAPKPSGDDDGTSKEKRKSPKKRPKSDDSSQDDQIDDNGSGVSATKRRAATKVKSYKDETPEDDYDFNDPFIDDASSDAFELSSDEDANEDSDYDDSQAVDEESQETRRLLKEAKKFTKGRGKKKD